MAQYHVAPRQAVVDFLTISDSENLMRIGQMKLDL